MAKKSPGVDPEIQTKLSARAWKLCQEAIDMGTITIGDDEKPEIQKQIIALRPQDLLHHVQWLAGLSARKRPRVAMPSNADDVLLSESR